MMTIYKKSNCYIRMSFLLKCIFCVLYAAMSFTTSVNTQWAALSIQKTSILKLITTSDHNVYAAAFDKEKGSLLLHSNDEGRTWNEIPSFGSNLAIAITNDGRMLCGIGTKTYCIYVNDPIGGYQTTEFEMYKAYPKEIHPFAQHGIALVGLFTIPFSKKTVNGVALNRSDRVTGWEYFDIELKKLDGYYAMGGSFPSVNTWFIISGSWPIQNIDVSCMLSGRLNIIVNTGLSDYQYEFLSLYDIPKDKYYGAISRTTDGGKTWKKVFDSNHRFYFNQIHCYNESSCLTIAEGSLSSYVLLTDDGGDTWEVVFRLQGQYSLHTCKMLSTKVMWVAGGTIGKSRTISEASLVDEDDDIYLGVYYYSDDGGGTWSMMTSDGYVYDLNFMNEEVGFAATIHRDHCEITKLQASN